MANIIYISLTGMTESLGESQVVQYLLPLAKKHVIHLLSFEKPIDKYKHESMTAQLQHANIEWKFFKYSNQYGMLSTLWQIIVAYNFLKKTIRKKHIQLIHARSLVAGVMGMLLKRSTKVRLLFDIRGFAIDEKIMEGRLKNKSLLTKLLKTIEAHVYQRADHVVTLTHVSKPIIKKKYNVAERNISVIPTCANLEMFKTISKDEKTSLRMKLGFSETDLIILHSGSINASVDFIAEIKLFIALRKINKKAKWLILNTGQHKQIKEFLTKYSLHENDYKIIAVDFDKMYQYLNIANICFFFIHPSFAKQASAPTKFAELVACQLLSVTNKKYGDMEFYLTKYGELGLLLDLDHLHQSPDTYAQKVQTFIDSKTKDIHPMFLQLSTKHFSKDIAVARYHEIYSSLASNSF